MNSKNAFMNDNKHEGFSYKNLSSIKERRETLNEKMPVLFYRLMQCAMLNVLSGIHGLEQASEYFRQAGFLSGYEFAKHTLDLTVEYNEFFTELQKTLQDLKIGVLCMEAFGHGAGNIVFTAGQDLDCSWTPITNKDMSTYDEGFIAGILDAYAEKI